MEHSVVKLGHKKRIALVAHDNKKQDLLEWARWNKELLTQHELFATGTTGKLLEEVLGTPVHKFQSGPLGGDQQIGAKISEGEIDFMIFFWDPLTEQPHDADVKALLRIAVVWNIPAACNRATADFMISSTLMTGEYDRLVTDYEAYRERQVAAIVGNKVETDKEESVVVESTDASADYEPVEE
jgi:methylglyoxal synthase